MPCCSVMIQSITLKESKDEEPIEPAPGVLSPMPDEAPAVLGETSFVLVSLFLHELTDLLMMTSRLTPPPAPSSLLTCDVAPPPVESLHRFLLFLARSEKSLTWEGNRRWDFTELNRPWQLKLRIPESCLHFMSSWNWWNKVRFRHSVSVNIEKNE